MVGGQEEPAKTLCSPPWAELPPGWAAWPQCPCPELPVGSRSPAGSACLSALSLFQVQDYTNTQEMDLGSLQLLQEYMRCPNLQFHLLVLMGLMTPSERPEMVSKVRVVPHCPMQ